MFDIGFWELTVIGVVALLVIGPERLPGVARTAGHWAGKARRYLGSVKADIDREMRAEELRKILDDQATAKELHEIIEDTKSTLDSAKNDYLVKAIPSEDKAGSKNESSDSTITSDK